MSAGNCITRTIEWWDVEWTENITSCGYDSLELAQEAAKRSAHADTYVVRVIQVTTTTRERVSKRSAT